MDFTTVCGKTLFTTANEINEVTDEVNVMQICRFIQEEVRDPKIQAAAVPTTRLTGLPKCHPIGGIRRERALRT